MQRSCLPAGVTMDANRDQAEADIAEARSLIDEIDTILVQLLNRRAVQVQRIGRAKHLLGLPVYQPDREQTVFERIEGDNEGPLEDNALRRLFERILDESRRLERTS